MNAIVPIRDSLIALATASIFAQASAQDVELFYISKYQVYEQPSSQIVQLIDGDFESSIGFEAAVELNNGGTVTSASITPPGGTAKALADEVDEWYYEFTADLLPELNADYPNGDYAFQIQTGNGPISVTLSLPGDAYPNIPRVSNFSSTQSINPAANFTLTWDTFAAGTANDFIEVSIEDDEGNDVFYDDTDGTATSMLMPAGSLQAGKTYSLELGFFKVVDVDVTSGTTGAAAYVRVTLLDIMTTGTPTENDRPWLEDFSPYGNETNVQVDSVVAFEFSEPMTQFAKIAWSGTGLAPENFSYEWSNDGKLLYAIYGDPAGLPQGITINWDLSPAAGAGTMQDLAGNELPNYEGSFNTASSPASGSNDVDKVYLLKSQTFIQTGAVPESAEWYAFETYVEINTPNGVTDGSITSPSGGILEVSTDWLGESPEAEASYTAKADLEQFFPTGTYQISLETAHDGSKSMSLDFPADDYPNTPTVTNIGAMATVNPEQALTISWDAFSGADDGDGYYIGVYISTDSGYDIYESPSSGEPGGLDGTSTSITVPAGTLVPGRRYWVELEFARFVDSDETGYPGTSAVAAFSKITEFEIQTTGTANVATTVITKYSNSASIQVSGDPYIEYRLEASNDLSNWFQIQYPRTGYENGEVTFNDWDSNFFSARYYRTVEIGDGEYSDPPVAIHGVVRDNSSNAPIAGATVSTSLDSNTATTNEDGSFFLHTSTVRESWQSYNIQITRAGYQAYSQGGLSGDQPRNQEYLIQAN